MEEKGQNKMSPFARDKDEITRQKSLANNTNILKALERSNQEISRLRTKIAALEKTQTDMFAFLREHLAPAIGGRKSVTSSNRM